MVRGIALAFMMAAISVSSSATSIDAMKWHRRVVLASAPKLDDLGVQSQQHILSNWRAGGEDRDISFITISGQRVDGASNSASDLRKRYNIARRHFEVLLIGKDGHIAIRSRQPISATKLQTAIDAMPMRREGGRWSRPILNAGPGRSSRLALAA